MKENIQEIYMNYLHAIRMHEEYGELFGDTNEIIEYYETKIKKYLLNVKNINNNTNKKSK